MNGAMPVIESVIADNRGLIDLQVSCALNPATVTKSAVSVTTAGADRVFGTSDDAQAQVSVSYNDVKRRIRIESSLAPDTRYRVQVDGDSILTVLAQPLDAEFNGAGAPTGDGQVGGDLVFFTSPASLSIARFTTPVGDINVQLFPVDAPLTVANFINIANRGDFDATVFHRLASGFVIQGGGFKSDPLLAPAPSVSTVQNEFVRSNIRGTISMAKLGNDPNSATNQWFFNIADNSANLDSQNGGFTVFGAAVSNADLQVIDALNMLSTLDASSLGGAFNQIPLLDTSMTMDPSQLTAADLVTVDRIAILMDLSANPPAKFSAPSIVIASGKGVQVTIFDLAGLGLKNAQNAVSVHFEGKGVKSITLRDPLPSTNLGVAVSGARFVGSIRDLRKKPGDFAFIVSSGPIESLRIGGSIIGADIAGKVVGDVFVDEDATGSGAKGDPIALLTNPPDNGLFLPSTIRIGGDVLADVVLQSPVASFIVKKSVRNATVVIAPADPAVAAVVPVNISATFFEDVDLRSAQPIGALRLGEWRDGDLTADMLQAPSAQRIRTTGAGAGVRNGDFEADVNLTGDAAATLALGRLVIAGVAFGADFTVAGAVGKVNMRDGATSVNFAAMDGIASLNLGSLSSVNIGAGGDIGTITVTEWIGGSLIADSVQTIIATGRGAFMSDGDLAIALSLNGSGAAATAVRRIKVAGDVGKANWTITGDAGGIRIAGDVDGSTIAVSNGKLKRFQAGRMTDVTLNVGLASASVRVTSWTGGALTGGPIKQILVTGAKRQAFVGDVRDLQATVQSIGSFLVRGDLLNSQINITANALLTRSAAVKQFTVDGVIDLTNIRTNARINIIAARVLRNSSIIVGAQPNLTGFPVAASQVNPALGSIRKILIPGGPLDDFALSNVFIVAPRIGSASFGDVETTGVGAPWGLAAAKFKSVSFTDVAGQNMTLLDGDLRVPAVFGEFEVRVGFLPA